MYKKKKKEQKLTFETRYKIAKKKKVKNNSFKSYSKNHHWYRCMRPNFSNGYLQYYYSYH